jgi:hypothetical protein
MPAHVPYLPRCMLDDRFVTAVTFLGVYLRDDLGAGTVGLSLVYCFTLSGLFQWIVRQSAELENQMISVERVTELTKLAQEKDGGGPPPKGWPSSGRVEFKDVTMRYSEDGQLVLKGLSFSIKDAEKIGIVGRTGAGKVRAPPTLLSTHARAAHTPAHTHTHSLTCKSGAFAVIDHGSPVPVVTPQRVDSPGWRRHKHHRPGEPSHCSVCHPARAGSSTATPTS